jgi:hypothetical protein
MAVRKAWRFRTGGGGRRTADRSTRLSFVDCAGRRDWANQRRIGSQITGNPGGDLDLMFQPPTAERDPSRVTDGSLMCPLTGWSPALYSRVPGGYCRVFRIIK